MFETIKEVDEGGVIKEHIAPLSKYNTNLLQADNAEDIYDINKFTPDWSISNNEMKKLDNWNMIIIISWMIWKIISRTNF